MLTASSHKHTVKGSLNVMQIFQFNAFVDVKFGHAAMSSCILFVFIPDKTTLIQLSWKYWRFIFYTFAEELFKFRSINNRGSKRKGCSLVNQSL